MRNSFGNLVKQVFGYGAIALGGLFLLAALTIPFSEEPEEAPGDNVKGFVGCLMFGLPPVGAGVLLLRSSHRDKEQKKLQAHAAKQQALDQLFYSLVEQKGSLTPLQLASAAQMSIPDAKAFLDDKAELLNPDFDVTSHGNMIYRFAEDPASSED